MRRYLIVANETLLGEPLAREVRRRLEGGASEGAELHVVVPASHGHGTWTEGRARAEASRRLQDGLAHFSAMGAAKVSGEVGDPSPVLAVGDALLASPSPFDEVIVSTLPLGVSRWLKQDAIHRLQRAHPRLAVTHVVSSAAAVAG